MLRGDWGKHCVSTLVEVREKTNTLYRKGDRYKLHTGDVKTSNTRLIEKAEEMMCEQAVGKHFPKRHMLANVGETC